MGNNYKSLWEIMQRQGRKKFIWFNYVFLVGICVPIVDRIIWILRGNYKSAQALIIDLIGRMTIYSIIAYLTGRSTWSYIQNKIVIEERKENLRNVEVKFCYFCGSEIDDSSNVCPCCGEKLEI